MDMDGPAAPSTEEGLIVPWSSSGRGDDDGESMPSSLESPARPLLAGSEDPDILTLRSVPMYSPLRQHHGVGGMDYWSQYYYFNGEQVMSFTIQVDQSPQRTPSPCRSWSQEGFDRLWSYDDGYMQTNSVYHAAAEQVAGQGSSAERILNAKGIYIFLISFHILLEAFKKKIDKRTEMIRESISEIAAWIRESISEIEAWIHSPSLKLEVTVAMKRPISEVDAGTSSMLDAATSSVIKKSKQQPHKAKAVLSQLMSSELIEDASGKRKECTTSRTRSKAWLHFTKVVDTEGVKGQCKYCGKMFKADPKIDGTSRLLRHIMDVHKMELDGSPSTKRSSCTHKQTTCQGSISEVDGAASRSSMLGAHRLSVVKKLRRQPDKAKSTLSQLMSPDEQGLQLDKAKATLSQLMSRDKHLEMNNSCDLHIIGNESRGCSELIELGHKEIHVEEPGESTSKTKSNVWLNFTKVEDPEGSGVVKEAQCKYCGNLLKADTKRNGTSRLRRHITHVHKMEL